MLGIVPLLWWARYDQASILTRPASQGMNSSFLYYQCTTNCIQTRFITFRGMRGAAAALGQKMFRESRVCGRHKLAAGAGKLVLISMEAHRINGYLGDEISK